MYTQSTIFIVVVNTGRHLVSRIFGVGGAWVGSACCVWNLAHRSLHFWWWMMTETLCSDNSYLIALAYIIQLTFVYIALFRRVTTMLKGYHIVDTKLGAVLLNVLFLLTVLYYIRHEGTSWTTLVVSYNHFLVTTSVITQCHKTQ